MTASGPRLKDLGRWLSGGTPPKDDPVAWDGDIPWLSAKDIDRMRLREPTAFITREAALRHSKLVDPGAIVIIVRGMALAHGLPVVRVDREAAFNQDLRALVPHEGIESRFLHYSFVGHRPAFGRHIDRAAHGTARVTESFYSERIWLPDFDVQQEIADFLDLECARIDRLIGRLDPLRAGTLEEFQAEVDAALASAAGEPRPLHWGVDPARPVMYGIVLPGDPVDDGVLLVKGGNVERNELMPEDLVCVAPEIEARYSRARLAAGDLLVTIRGSFGAVAIVPAEIDGANITQDTARVAPSARADARYLRHALRSSGARRQIGERVRGTGVKGLNIYDLKRIVVPFPPPAEQRRLADILDAAERKATAVCAKVDELAVTLTEYRDALITEAVTGQLDVARVSDKQMEDAAAAVAADATQEVLSA